MDNLSPKSFLQKIDQAIFENIEKFKNDNTLQDFYNGLEEEQQKILKIFISILIFTFPILFLTVIWKQNDFLKQDLAMRGSIISKANSIIGKKQGLEEITPRIFSSNPIDSQSMMSSRLTGILSNIGADLSKIQVADYNSSSISASTFKSESRFQFNGLSTDELINLLTAMISMEKFRILEIEINRNPNSNLLQGNFKALHFSVIPQAKEDQS